MKAKLWVTGLITVLVAALVVQQLEIQTHRDRIDALEGLLGKLTKEGVTAAGTRRMGPSSTDPSLASKTGPRNDASPRDSSRGSDEASLNRSLRRISENPAGRAMMNQGVKAMSAVWFADLVDQFDLTREEEDYFLRLVAGGMSSQQNIGMKFMVAETEEEREALTAEMEEAERATKEAVKDFLNNEEDYAAYELYHKQLPERQQIEGLRDTMLEAGVPLSPIQEEQVIDAMYRARTSGIESTNWQGTSGMEAIASGDAVERFEREWDRSARITAEEVGKVLEGDQLTAFTQFQDQMKDVQLVGIKMAEKMFPANKNPGEDK